MKVFTAVVMCALSLWVAGAARAQDAAAAPAFASDEERISYCIGVQIGMELKKNNYPLNTTVIGQAMQDVLDGKDLRVSMDQVQQGVMDYAQKAKEAQMQRGEALKKQAEEFMATNKATEGVKVTDSGLQYKVITAGTGPVPTASDVVKVHYTGTLVDGTKFDSSYDRGKPAQFPVKGVIKGWTEALQLMPVGSKWQLVIPSNLAYGPDGQGPIPPDATLIFEVELLEIVKSGGNQQGIEIKPNQ